MVTLKRRKQKRIKFMCLFQKKQKSEQGSSKGPIRKHGTKHGADGMLSQPFRRSKRIGTNIGKGLRKLLSIIGRGPDLQAAVPEWTSLSVVGYSSFACGRRWPRAGREGWQRAVEWTLSNDISFSCWRSIGDYIYGFDLFQYMNYLVVHQPAQNQLPCFGNNIGVAFARVVCGKSKIGAETPPFRPTSPRWSSFKRATYRFGSLLHSPLIQM